MDRHDQTKGSVIADPARGAAAWRHRARHWRPAAMLFRLPAVAAGPAVKRASHGHGHGHGADAFRPSALAIIETPPSPARREYLFVLCALFAAALAWSWFGRMASFAEAQGRIQVAGRTKVIEPRAAGQVTAIRVHDGDHVDKGAVLVQLDPTDAEATRALITAQLIDLRAEIARWQAEIAVASKDPIDLHPALAWAADIPQNVRQREENVLRADLAQLAAALADLKAQRAEEISAKDKFAGSVAAQKGLVATIAQEVAMYRQLEGQGWASTAKLLTALARLKEAQTELTRSEGNLADAAAAIPVIDSKIAAARQSFIAGDTQQLVAADRQVEDLAQQLRKAKQAVANMILRAPISGSVEASAVTTIGQVVTPGQQLMEIVPQDLPLQIQAYVPNTDIGFIKPGQKAEIKVAAFPYATYGMIAGTVTTLANDALPASGKNRLQTASLDGAIAQTTAAQDTGSIMFPVVVTPSHTTMDVDGRKIPLTPGMAVVVDLKTEELRPLDYVIWPLVELFSTAAHER
jgi:hemolysin D